jgi:DNA-binding NtrC family response regulator
MDLFRNYDWPGNVRELKNLVEMAVHARRGKVDLSGFLYLSRLKDRESRPVPIYSADRPFKLAKNDLVSQFEKEYVRQVLVQHGWNISQAAREAQIERAYLQRLIKKHKLTP